MLLAAKRIERFPNLFYMIESWNMNCMFGGMTLLKAFALFAPLTLSFAQVANQSTPAYFTVYNTTGDGTSTVSEQFVVKIANPTVIQQARAMLSLPESERPSVGGTVVKAPSYFNAPWSFHLDPVSIFLFDQAVEVCDSSTSYLEEHLSEAGEAFLPDSVWCPWSSKLLAEVPEPAGASTSLRIASAASDSEAAISPGALISIYGQNLTNQTEEASSTESPVTLAGITVEITPNGGANSRQLPLIFASPSQVNALIPADMPQGLASISLQNASGSVVGSPTFLEAVGPALFVVSQDNINYAAASILQIHADGTSSTESLVAVDPTSGALMPQPLNFGAPTDEVYLSLYGTGFGNSDAAAVSLTLAPENTPILFAGPQGQIAGVDQVNIPLPQSLSTQPALDLQLSVQNPNGFPVKTNLVHILVGTPATSGVAPAMK
jgi:uncharacterized protein (TIGR03437 family)